MERIGHGDYSVHLAFEEIQLPPFQDILLIGKKSPHGRMGLSRSLQFLMPDEFEVIEVDDPVVDTAFINKRLLKKMDRQQILSVLRRQVFPFVREDEILKVDFKVKIYSRSVKE
ncbi:MAG: hypothetical protein AAGU19_10325 [Prolixibacteraceae bacterium]